VLEEFEIMVASLRSTLHVQEAARLGADAATMPKRALDELVHHPLTDTLQKGFLAEWKRL
jgi:transaldolase